MDAAGVGGQVDPRGAGVQLDVALLGLEHGQILVEGHFDLVEDGLGEFRVVRLEVMGLGPEVMGGALGLGGDGVEVAHADAAHAVALGGAGARVRAAHVEPDEGRRGVFDDLPAVDVAPEVPHLGVGGRGRGVDHPAGHHHPAVFAFGGHPGRVGHGVVADGGPVHVGQVGQVQQVLDDEAVVALGVVEGALDPPLGIVQPVKVLDSRRVGQRRVAHPDPDPAIPFLHRVASHPQPFGRRPPAGNPHALPAWGVFHAVVGALEAVLDQLAAVEGKAAVDAAVRQGHRRAVQGAVEHHRIVEINAPHGPPGHLVAPGRHVPGIADEHGWPPLGARFG